MSKRSQEDNPSQQQDVSKRSRKLKKGQSSKGQSSKELLPRFIDERSERRYAQFSSLVSTDKIVPCFYLDSSKFGELGLDRVMDIFGELSVFMTCDETICEPTLWEFYANMENVGPTITSRINGKDIELNANKIRNAFGITRDGTAFNPYFASRWPDKDWCEQNRMNLVELSNRYFKVEWHKNISAKREYKPMNLAAFDRVVYELMWLLLANSSGHSSEPTTAHVLFFFALMEGKKIDYARYLIDYLTFVNAKGKDLPCGNLIMKVLKHMKVKAPKPPIVPTYMYCKEITKDFFKNKRVEYRENDWHTMSSKNASQKSSRGEGSSSNMGNENLEAMIERAIEKAQAPLLEKIDDLSRALDKSLILQSTVIDELDVMRQSHLMDMDDTRYNKVLAYRKELENQRIARMGMSAKNLRNEELRSARNDDESSSERTGSHRDSPSGNRSQSGGS